MTTTPNDEPRRVVIAITEATQLRSLWSIAQQRITERDGDLLVVYVSDERWRRAASLPFTVEVSRISGAAGTFTPKRAEELSIQTVRSVEIQLKELAGASGLRFALKVLTGADPAQLSELTGGGRSTLIAPSLLAREAVYALFEKLDWRIELIETG